MSATRVVTFGETMALFRASSIGSLAHVSTFDLSVGGAESNVAIALERLGTRVTWVGRVGNDSLGERVVRELRAEGLEVLATVDPAAPTGVMVKEYRTNEAVRVHYYRAASAGSGITAAEIAAADIETASLLHVTGITPALSEGAAAATTESIAAAVAAGVPVSFDVNHRPRLWGSRDSAAVYRDIAGRATIVFAGVEEARLLAPEVSEPADLVAAIADLGPSQVVLKLGAEGCLALVDGVRYQQTAVPVTVVDTVGAGDAFVAGYLAELAHPVPTRLATAVAVAAFACLSPGDWEGYPRRDELGLLESSEPVTR